ncbi:hypothetical protein D3C76_998990 [compost metagenome]
MRFAGQLHTGRRIFRVVLVDAKYPSCARANECIVSCQQRIHRAAHHLVGSTGEHAVGLRAHVLEQSFLILCFEELSSLGGLLQPLFRRDRLVIGQLYREIETSNFSELEVVIDLELAQ